ncbi:hypothetical protein L7F22_030016 [Adiantum nelumboides]|nr:hypothetical protein [Adiantum nelumboides]
MEGEKVAHEIVDWRFRPVDSKRRLGGWRGSFFMFGAACCGYLGFGGIFFNLVLYLIRVWGESPSTAANDLTNLLGTMFFTALIGAFLGDAYLGRLWTVLLFLLIYVMGCILLGVAVTLQEHADVTKPLPSGLKTFLFAALYITAVGNGSYEPVLASLGGDQFETQEAKTTFFNWFFVFCNVGQLIALTFVTYFENNGQWALGFWISGGIVLISLPVYLVGTPFCRQFRPGGNPFLRVVQVFVCALRKKARVSPRGNDLYEVQDGGGLSAIPGSRRLCHSKQFRWLDRAALASSDEEKTNPWRVCTITQVEEVKCLLRIVPFFIAGVIFNTIIAQLTTLFIEQGATMDGHIGRHFNIPPGSMQVFTVLACISFTPFYDYILVPWLRKRTGHEKGITTLQRMGWGIFISIIAMVVAAVVEKKRLNAARASPLIDVPFAVVPISIYWLVPQYVIVGIALVFSIVGQMDFFYTEISDGMRSVGISLPLVCRGLGSYASTLLVTITTHVTTSGGKLGWIPRNLNRGHIDYFYWLLAVLMAVTLVFYLIAANFYTYLQVVPAKEPVEEVGLVQKAI